MPNAASDFIGRQLQHVQDVFRPFIYPIRHNTGVEYDYPEDQPLREHPLYNLFRDDDLMPTGAKPTHYHYLKESFETALEASFSVYNETMEDVRYYISDSADSMSIHADNEQACLDWLAEDTSRDGENLRTNFLYYVREELGSDDLNYAWQMYWAYQVYRQAIRFAHMIQKVRDEVEEED